MSKEPGRIYDIRFRDVIIADDTFIQLYKDAGDAFAGYRDEYPGAKLHVIESVLTGVPTQLRLTGGKEDEPTHRVRIL